MMAKALKTCNICNGKIANSFKKYCEFCGLKFCEKCLYKTKEFCQPVNLTQGELTFMEPEENAQTCGLICTVCDRKFMMKAQYDKHRKILEDECEELDLKQTELKETYDGYNEGVSEYIIRKQNIENMETNHKSDEIFQQRRLRTLKHDV